MQISKSSILQVSCPIGNQMQSRASLWGTLIHCFLHFLLHILGNKKPSNPAESGKGGAESWKGGGGILKIGKEFTMKL